MDPSNNLYALPWHERHAIIISYQDALNAIRALPVTYNCPECER